MTDRLSRRDGLAVAGLFALEAAVVAMGWQRWPDPVIDFGREAYVPWQLSLGKRLYRDIAYFNGPLSPAFNAVVFRLGRPSLHALFATNAAVLLVTVVLLYALLRRLFERGPTFVGTALFVLVNSGSQLVDVGNYNFLAPYSHEATHGFLLGLIALLGAATYGESNKRRWLWLSGVATGLCILTKIELTLATVVAVAVTLFAPRRQRDDAGAPRWSFATPSAVPQWLIAVLIPVFAAVAIVARWDATAARDVLGSFVYAARPEISGLEFYRREAGLLHPLRDLQRMAFAVAGWASGLALIAWIDLRSSRLRATSRRLIQPVLALVLFAVCTAIPWLDASRALLIGVAFLLGIALRRALRPPAPPAANLEIGFAMFALLLLMKMGLAQRTWHYGFVLSAAAVPYLAAAMVERFPRWVSERGGNGQVSRLGAMILLAAVAGAHLKGSLGKYRAKREPLGKGADLFWTDERAAELRPWVEALRAEPVKSLLVLPEGAMLNYFARRTNPTPYLSVLPPERAMFGEDAMLAALQKAPPDEIVVLPRDLRDYGEPDFGAGYAPRIHDWVTAHYRAVDAPSEGERWLRR